MSSKCPAQYFLSSHFENFSWVTKFHISCQASVKYAHTGMRVSLSDRMVLKNITMILLISRKAMIAAIVQSPYSMILINRPESIPATRLLIITPPDSLTIDAASGLKGRKTRNKAATTTKSIAMKAYSQT